MKVVLLTLPQAPKILLLEKLRDVFFGRKVDKRLHVTVRGPFTTYPDHESLVSVRSSADENRLLISGVGAFANEKVSVVYLRVQGTWLRQIWLKPDFPVSKFGFNPHITMYEGSDHERAKKVLKFLRLNNVELIVEDFGLAITTLRQKTLFEEAEMPVSRSPVMGQLSSLTLDRARQAFDNGWRGDRFRLEPMPNSQDSLAMDFAG